MRLILMLVAAFGLVVGSLAAAALLCWFLWYAFRLVLHPEWGVSVVLALVVLAFAGALPKSQFLEMAMAFAVVAAVPLWFAGRAWRGQRRLDANSLRGRKDRSRSSQPVIPTQSAPSPQLYPAITACIGQGRHPTRDEIHVVASRLWREGFAQRFGPQTEPASFAARRMLLRAATAALRG